MPVLYNAFLMHKPGSLARTLVSAVLTFTALALLSISVAAQQLDPSSYSGLRWRMIGPFRGGRSNAVSGVPGRPNVYYFGAVGGGVWKSTNGGETWEPVFDSQPIASIGALAIAPSDPDIIYVGTGEATLRSNLTYGNGMYKSTDGGKTWSHIGLEDSRHIARVLVDPHDPNVVLVAALGHAYGPNSERGVFRTTDGGAHWQKVLYKDGDTGAIDLAADPDNPQTVYAALLHDQRPPWSIYAPTTNSGAIYKSTDSGVNWKPITGGGLPPGEWGRVGLAVSRGTRGQRVYALIDAKDGGLFRSDDAGNTWVLAGTDPRIRGRLWYFGEVVADPKDPDTVYLPNVSIYRSTDAGKTFTALKGAPGGDDYHAMWIDPSNSQRMFFGSDQGVGISVDGGQSWGSWFNQPTAQFYHVVVDNRFPYHVYGAQQDSGSVDTTSRGNDGSITFRDWHPAGAGESGYIAVDPTDSNILYGGGTYGEVFRYDKRTGQAQIIAPLAVRSFGSDPTKTEYRFTWTSPLVFSPQDSHTLYFGSQYVLKSTNQGNSWEKISPDLTGTDPKASREGPTTLENAIARGHGVVYTIAPSPIRPGVIWAGTDTGRIHFTSDGGKTWRDVTGSLTPKLQNWGKISMIEASHFDAGTSYVAIDRHRMDDFSAYFCRITNYGSEGQCHADRIPQGAYLRAVREDPVRKGLLFAGTELGVYFSLNDGISWQPLRLNMPVTPVHDLVIKDNDLVIATHGRSFWILDDISPLRQITADLEVAPVYLFKPAPAVRVRASTNHDTPLTPELPAGENPPPGAILYYYLKSAAQGEVKLEVLDGRGQVARAFSSADKPSSPSTPPPFPQYWFRPPEQLSTAAGMHRFVWDLRYTAPSVTNRGYSMATVFGRSVPVEPEGPFALPGKYQIRLTVDGKSYVQPLTLTMDPRVKVTTQDLEKQFALEKMLVDGVEQANRATREIHEARTAGHISEETERKLAGARRSEEDGGAVQPLSPSLSQISGTLSQLVSVVDSADAAPTSQASRAAEQALGQLQTVLAEWKKLNH
ncbi:MAG TPA: hypothetical protein VKE93_18175 [Candidatus Angelobacter sp.]|nr:hypothetical protein [Candidatus Angelobacter sp.]